MKQELTGNGFRELLTADDVEQLFESKEGTTFVVFNSVCGCAARNARPGAVAAVKSADKLPDNLVTVFAGVDAQAVAKARSYTFPYPPSSPSMGLFKDGKLVHFIERHHIEGVPAEAIAANLKAAFEQYC
jgi:putative YphP/YqiW family bacilliredoxin